MSQELFQLFANSVTYSADEEAQASNAPWADHKDFPGVSLKHLITACHTGGQFSCHLVRIAPGKAIGLHTHPASQELHEVLNGSGHCVLPGHTRAYAPGVVSLVPLGVPHEVVAGEDGLYMLAKFIPALC